MFRTLSDNKKWGVGKAASLGVLSPGLGNITEMQGELSFLFELSTLCLREQTAAPLLCQQSSMHSQL
jgi:hypothetical protein